MKRELWQCLWIIAWSALVSLAANLALNSCHGADQNHAQTFEARTFLAYELAEDDQGEQHFGGGIGARYWLTQHWGLGAEAISWATRDTFVDQWAMEAAWRQRILREIEVVVSGQVGRNEEDRNSQAALGAELHWQWIYAGARLMHEDNEEWKGLFTSGLNIEW